MVCFVRDMDFLASMVTRDINNLFLVILLLGSCSVVCFNFDTEFPDIISSKYENDYFGYSVILQKGNPSMLIVGAIKANSTFEGHKNIIDPGVVYSCALDKNKNCTQYIIDRRENLYVENYGNHTTITFKHRKDNEALGATISAGVNVGDPLVVCAPRWKSEMIRSYHLNGICYLISNSCDLNADGKSISPLLNLQNILYRFKQYYYSFGCAGMSLNLLKNNSEILMGAPGVLTFRGTLIRYQISKLGLSALSSQSSGFNIPNPMFIPKLEPHSYLGYSSTYGVFKKEEGLWYVAGAPRAFGLNGRVILFSYVDSDEEPINIHHEMFGEQAGSYFGSTLLAYQKTENDLSDLIVGAPTYSLKGYDEGCVYYYRNNGDGYFHDPIKIFGDPMEGSHFGFAISDLGDLNHDSFNDIAISAPYEDNGKGAVYIFLGSINGLFDNYSQKITAKAIDPNIFSMGFSLSKGLDIDGNDFNDLAIGAYKSGKIVVLKAKPIIKYYGELTCNVKDLPMGSNQTINLKYCLKYNSTSRAIKTVETVLKFQPDYRISNWNLESKNEAKELVLHENVNHCENLTLPLQSDIDYSLPIKFKIIYEVKQRKLTEFCNTCPMTDPDDSKTLSIELPFGTNCGDDNVCTPDLKLSAIFVPNLEFIILGQHKTLKLKVNVQNLGETAYLYELIITTPNRVDLERMPNMCTLKNKIVNCLIKSPLQTNELKQAEFEFSLKKLTTFDKFLVFSLKVDSQGSDIKEGENKLQLKLPIKTRNSLEVNGESKPHQVVYADPTNSLIPQIVNFTHEYTFTNLGPSPLQFLEFTLHVPVSYHNKTFVTVYNPESTSDEFRIRCEDNLPQGDAPTVAANDEKNINSNTLKNGRSFRSLDLNKTFSPLINNPANIPVNKTLFFNCTSNSGYNCKRIFCRADNEMKKEQTIRIRIPMYATVSKLGSILNEKNLVLLQTEIYTNSNEKRKKMFVKTLLIGYISNKEIPIWIFILGVTIGFLVLLLIVSILHKLQFFSRPLKQKLENPSEEEIVQGDCLHVEHGSSEPEGKELDSPMPDIFETSYFIK